MENASVILSYPGFSPQSPANGKMVIASPPEPPLRPRLEPLDKQRPNTVALMSGPSVLFEINPAGKPTTRETMLSAQKSSANTWQSFTPAGPQELLSFTALADEPYTTYFTLSH
jgi:uncharacterized protein